MPCSACVDGDVDGDEDEDCADYVGSVNSVLPPGVEPSPSSQTRVSSKKAASPMICRRRFCNLRCDKFLQDERFSHLLGVREIYLRLVAAYYPKNGYLQATFFVLIPK